MNLNPKELKKYLIPTLAVFVVITIFNIFFHGMVMEKFYVKYSHIFRAQDIIDKYKYLMWTANLIYSAAFCYIYSKGHEKKNPVDQGFRYGLWISLLIWVPNALITYTIYPFPKDLIYRWLIGYTAQSIVAGITAGYTFKGSKP